MEATIKPVRKSARDVAYYSQRYRNRVFSTLIAFISQECEKKGITKKDIADRLDKDPGQITRWLTQPSNLTLDTISALLLSVDAEAEPPEINRFADKSAPNYIHPLMLRVLGKSAPPQSQPTTSGATPVIVGTGMRTETDTIVSFKSPMSMCAWQR